VVEPDLEEEDEDAVIPEEFRMTPEEKQRFSQSIDQSRQFEDLSLMRSVMRQVKQSPDFAAEVNQLGIELGLDPSVVERNIDKVRQLKQQKTIEDLQLAGRDPILARMLLDPKFAAIAHDQTNQLSFIEQTYDQLRAGYYTSRMGRIYDKVRRGEATDADKAEAVDLEMAMEALPQDSSGHGLAGLWYGTARILGQFGDTLPRAFLAGGALGGTALALGQLGPQATLPEELVTAPTMFWAGFRGSLFASTAEIEAGHAYKTMIDLGIDHQQASNSAFWVGLVNGTLEVVGFSALTATARKELGLAITRSAARQLIGEPTMTNVVRRAATAYVKDAGGEIVTEVVQEVSSIIAEEINLARQMQEDPSKLNWDEVNARSGFLDRIGSIIAETVRGVGLISSVGPMLQLRGEMNGLSKFQATEKFINNLSSGVQDTKLTQRDPTRMERYLQQLGEGTPVENVYLKPEELEAAMKSAGLSATQMAEMAPDVWKAYLESKTTGMIEMPTHTWGAKFLSTKFGQSLAQEVRVDPDGINMREVREISRQGVSERAKQILDEKEQTDKQFVIEVKEVRKQMADQIMAANPNLSREEASNQALLYSHFAVIYSGYERMSPKQWHETNGLRFLSDEAAELELEPALEQLQPQDRLRVEQSALRDESGRPLRVYHGTTKAFKVNRNALNGIWFALDPKQAQPADGSAGMTRAAYLDVQNPYTLTPEEHYLFRHAGSGMKGTARTAKSWARSMRARLEREGYDSMIIPGYAVVVFDNKRIINAIGAGLQKEGALRQDEVAQEGATQAPAAAEPAAEVEEPAEPTSIEEAQNDPAIQVSRIENANQVATSRSWLRGRDIKVALQSAINKSLEAAGLKVTQKVPIKPTKKNPKGGEKTEVVDSPEVEQYLVNVGINDALFALKQNPNAVGWYDLKTRQAIALVALIHPELNTDPDARFAFIYALAVTSNGMKVNKNFTLAERAYRAYKRKGVMPSNIGEGNASKAINETLDLFNTLKKRLGIEKMREAMLAEGSVSMFQGLFGAEVSGEKAQTIVRGAAVLGPKIGNGFFSNLYGMFDQLTMDRWLIRTWGRWTGTLISERPDLIADAKERLQNAVSNLTPDEKSRIENFSMTYEVKVKKKTQTKTFTSAVRFDTMSDEEIAAQINKATIIKPVRERMMQMGGGFDELRKAANAYTKQLDGQKEAPSGADERVYIRRVFQRILDEIRTIPEYANLEMADLQAVLWYAERRVYESAKEKESDTDAEVEGYADKEAPDYAVAAAKLAKTRKVSKAAIEAALKKEEQGGRTTGTRLGAVEAEGGTEAGAVRQARSIRILAGGQAIIDARPSGRNAREPSWAISRESTPARGRLRILGARVSGQFKLGKKLKNRLQAAGENVDVTLYELASNDPRSAGAYREAITAYKNRKKEKGASVYAYEEADYSKMRLLLTEDGKSGVAVKPDGDIVSVFSGEGNARTLVEAAISIGGRKADAFDIGLAELYAAHGLKVVSRTAWNEAYKPEGWDKEHFKGFNNGEPDVVFMVYDPKWKGFYSPTDGGPVVSDTDAANKQAAELQRVKAPKPLYSPTARGRFYQNKRLAVLDKTADANSSTVVHEMSHFFFTTMVRVASGENPPMQVVADVKTLLQWFGEKGDLGIDPKAEDIIQQWNDLSFEKQERFHEQLAYSFEIYAFEGKAPTPKLEPLFARMRNWMIRAYKDIRGTLNRIYKGRFGIDLPAMTPEVKMVFDRMVASQEAVQQAEAMRRMLPLFQDRESFLAAGYTEEEWDEYQAALEEAHNAAVTDLTRASLSQLRWLKNARSRVLKELQRQAAKVREPVEARIRSELKNELVYIARELLSKDQAASKLSQTQVEERFGNLDKKATEAAIKKLGTGRRGVVAKSGMDIDVAAQIFGYSSGDALISDLLTAPPLEEAVQARADKEMLEQFGELTDPQKMEAAIEKALHNEARARFIAVEHRFLSRSKQPARLSILAARLTARTVLGGRSIRSLRPDRYAQAEAAAARDAEAASRPAKGRKTGDPSKAVDAKYRQLLNNQMVVAAIDARAQIEKNKKFFKKLNRSNQKLVKNGYDINIVNAARWLVARIGLLSDTMVDRTVDYLEMLQRYDPELFNELSPVLARFKDVEFDYRDLTLDEFMAISDAVRSLFGRARRSQQHLVGNRRMMARESARKLYETIKDQVPDSVAGTTRALTDRQKVGRLLLGSKASLTRMEHLIRALDGGERGQWGELFYDEVRLSLDKYRKVARMFTTKLVDMVRGLELNQTDIDATAEFGYTFKGDAELLGFLLHTGNQSNLEKVLIGGRPDSPWATFDIDGKVDQSKWLKLRARLIESGRLKKEHFRFVQKVWDMMEEMKPILQDAHFELENYYFKEVPAQEFTIEYPDGSKETYRGGYVPAAADKELMQTSQDYISPEAMDREFRAEIPKVDFGSVKERNDNYRGRPLLLDVRMIAQHIDKGIRYAYVQPRIRDVLKVLNVQFDAGDGKMMKLSEAMNRIHPNLVNDVILPWLDRAASQSLYKPGGDSLWNEIGKFLRRNTGIAVMMLNPVNAMQQLTGISNSFLYVKPAYLVAALQKYRSDRKGVIADIVKLSDFMDDRLSNQVGEMRSELDEMVLNPSNWSRAQAWTTRKAYALQAMVQNQVDIVTWVGAYDQAMATRKDGETVEQQQRRAVLEANSAVRLSQGSFNPEDVARYEVGSPWQRTWTQFTGYFNNVLNTITYSNDKKKAVALTMLIPMVISEAIAKVLWGQWNADDPDQEDWMLDGWVWDGIDIFILSQVRGAAAMIPAVGPAVLGVVESAASDRGYGDKVVSSPAMVSLFRGISSLSSLAKAAADQDREISGRYIRDVLTLITQLTGLPIGPISRPVGYAVDWASGAVEPRHAGDVVRGLITGRASTGTKQE
jgi:hypothetical protein